MGGPHDCQQLSEDIERLEVILPEPPIRGVCGNYLRSRRYQDIIIDGSQLTHLRRFFERVQDDDEVVDLYVAVRAGTLQFFGTPGMYSAEVGYSDDE
jgi:hypothetical protein